MTFLKEINSKSLYNPCSLTARAALQYSESDMKAARMKPASCQDYLREALISGHLGILGPSRKFNAVELEGYSFTQS